MNDARYHFVPNAGGQPTIVGGEGCWLHTADGRRILDGAGGAIVGNIGWGRAEVADATRAAMVHGAYSVPIWPSEQRLLLRDRLVERWLPPGFTKVFFTSGGSESTDSALRLARNYQLGKGRPDRWKVVGRHPSYHGMTLGTIAVASHSTRQVGFEPLLLPFPKVPWDDPEAVVEVIEREDPETIAGFIAEPITGAAGACLTASDDYWRVVTDVCHRYDILLITDEVMCGLRPHRLELRLPALPVRARRDRRRQGPRWRLRAHGRGLRRAPRWPTCWPKPGSCTSPSAATTRRVRPASPCSTSWSARAWSTAPPRWAQCWAIDCTPSSTAIPPSSRSAVAACSTASSCASRSQQVVAEALSRDVWIYPAGSGPVPSAVMVAPPFVITDDELDLFVTTLRAVDRCRDRQVRRSAAIAVALLGVLAACSEASSSPSTSPARHDSDGPAGDDHGHDAATSDDGAAGDDRGHDAATDDDRADQHHAAPRLRPGRRSPPPASACAPTAARTATGSTRPTPTRSSSSSRVAEPASTRRPARSAALPTARQSEPTTTPTAFSNGIFDFADARNPLADYSFVFAPYCTGDVHLGTAAHEYGPELTVQHKGAINATDGARRRSPRSSPTRRRSWSPGRAPARCRRRCTPGWPTISCRTRRSRCWPTAPAPTPTIRRSTPGSATLWGTAAAIPPWPENDGLTVGDWGAPELFVQAGKHDPSIIFGRHDYAFDFVQTIFSALVGLPTDRSAVGHRRQRDRDRTGRRRSAQLHRTRASRTPC